MEYVAQTLMLIAMLAVALVAIYCACRSYGNGPHDT